MVIASPLRTVSFFSFSFDDLVIFVSPLVLGPRPHDDSFIYGTVGFLVRVLWTWLFWLFTFVNLVVHFCGPLTVDS